MADWEVAVSADGVAVPDDLVHEAAEIARYSLAESDAGEVELSITFVNDERIGELNREYLSREGPTDVLSFPLRGPLNRLVGDVYIDFDQARRQAEELGVPLREEVLRLAIHGTLHALGWDHPEVGDRVQSPMFVRQEELLAAYLNKA